MTRRMVWMATLGSALGLGPVAVALMLMASGWWVDRVAFTDPVRLHQALVVVGSAAATAVGVLLGAWIGGGKQQALRRSAEPWVYVPAGLLLVAVLLSVSAGPGRLMLPPLAHAALKSKEVKPLTADPFAFGSNASKADLAAFLDQGKAIDLGLFQGADAVVPVAARNGFGGEVGRLLGSMAAEGFPVGTPPARPVVVTIRCDQKPEIDGLVNSIGQVAARLVAKRDAAASTHDARAGLDAWVGPYARQAEAIKVRIAPIYLTTGAVKKLEARAGNIQAVPSPTIEVLAPETLKLWDGLAGDIAEALRSLADTREEVAEVNDKAAARALETLGVQVAFWGNRVKQASAASKEKDEKRWPELSRRQLGISNELADAEKKLGERKAADAALATAFPTGLVPGPEYEHVAVRERLQDLRNRITESISTASPVALPGGRPDQDPSENPSGRDWVVSTVYATVRAKFELDNYGKLAVDPENPGGPTIDDVLMARWRAKFEIATDSQGHPPVYAPNFTFDEACRIASAEMFEVLRDYAKNLKARWTKRRDRALTRAGAPGSYPARSEINALPKEHGFWSSRIDQLKEMVRGVGWADNLVDTSAGADGELLDKAVQDIGGWVSDYIAALDSFALMNAQPDAKVQDRLATWTAFLYTGDRPGGAQVIPFKKFVQQAQQGAGAIKELTDQNLKALTVDPQPAPQAPKRDDTGTGGGEHPR